jgi:hypothetical protein
MLKQWLDPLLLLIGLTSGIFYVHSSQQATPVQASARITAAPATGGLLSPLAQNQDPPADGTPLAPPDLEDVDAMLVIDNSGSMFGYTCANRDPITANDRSQMRIRSAEIVIAALAADLKPRETKLGIVSFGNTAELVSPLEQLSNEPDDPVRTNLRTAIQNPPCAGDTNIVAALRVAQEELRSERHNPANIRAIIFLTDGLPTLGGGEREIRQILDELQAENVLLFTVLLGDDPQLAAFGRFWQSESDARANVHFYRLTSADQMLDVYQRIKVKLDQRDNAPDDTPPLPPGPSVAVNIPPNVAQAVLTVMKPAVGTQITLTDPAGGGASQRPPDQFRILQNNSTIDVLIVDRPEAGDWVVSAAGGEEITVLQPELKSVYAVQLVQPGALQPLAIDKPTDIVVQVIDDATQIPLAGPFTFTGSYRLLDAPANATTPLNLTQSPTDPTQYSVTLPAGTFTDLSSYIFTFQAEDSVGLRSNEVTYQLLAGRVPSIASVTARQRVYVDEENMLSVTVANPESADGQPVPLVSHTVPNNSPINFTAQTSTTFQANLNPLKKPGQYTINVVYAGKTQLGTDFLDQKSIQIVVEEHFSTILLRTIAAILALLTLVYLIYRYILIPFTPLVWLAQKIGLAPQGYIRVQPDTGLPGSQLKVGDLLKQRRKLRQLTLGIGKGYDISLSPPADAAAGADDDDDTSASRKKQRPGLRGCLFGKRSLAVIGRRFRSDTFIQKLPGTPRNFKNYADEEDIADDTVEFSLDELS